MKYFYYTSTVITQNQVVSVIFFTISCLGTLKDTKNDRFTATLQQSGHFLFKNYFYAVLPAGTHF